MATNKMKTLFISLFISYIFTTYINWHYDPSEWSEFARFASLLFALTMFGMVKSQKTNV